jgi:hypothetical protein
MKNTVVTLLLDFSITHPDDADVDEVTERVLEDFHEVHGGNVTRSVGEANYHVVNGADAKITLEPENIEPEPFQIPESKVEAATNDSDRVVAEYNKQVWRNDYASPVGTEYWDVTCLIDKMTDEEARELMDNDYSTDQLVHSYSGHEGPHSVYVTDQVWQYKDLED